MLKLQKDLAGRRKNFYFFFFLLFADIKIAHQLKQENQ